MTTDADHFAYFTAQHESTREFWARFGRQPDVAGRRVLDIGCGHGAMSVALAQKGADVLGVDLDPVRIDWARRNVAERYPSLTPPPRFEARYVQSLPPDERFDLAVCKDTMEHVDDVRGLLADLRARLEPGGQLWAGFSPLYASPFGDHGRTGLRVPWAHAALPPRIVYRSASRLKGEPVTGLGDIGLNGMTAAEFRDHARSAGMRISSIAYNRGDKPLLRVLGYARRVAWLERWATVSIYAVLVPE